MSLAPSETILARLERLHPRLIDLSLGRLQRLLAALGHPERRLPPVVHVAGTNGKGSTCAFLRAIAEAAGQRAHVYTSPHLVHFHERIRLAGRLVGEPLLAATLAEVEAANAEAPITIFEMITAVGLLLFSRVPADLLILEVGLGGRFDATNVIERPVATAITSLSMDHMEFLGDTLGKIAFEKAGILKPGVACATGRQAQEALDVLQAVAAETGAPLLARDRDWEVAATATGMTYREATTRLDLPPPALLGAHQMENAGIAIAALRAWRPAWLTDAAIAAGVAGAEWPGRLQRLRGHLAARLPADWELWLDGGHNAGGGAALAAQIGAWRDRPLHLVIGMKGSKAVGDFLAPLLPGAASIWAVAEPGPCRSNGSSRPAAVSPARGRPSLMPSPPSPATGHPPGC